MVSRLVHWLLVLRLLNCPSIIRWVNLVSCGLVRSCILIILLLSLSLSTMLSLAEDSDDGGDSIQERSVDIDQ